MGRFETSGPREADTIPAPVEWTVTKGLVAYPDALAAMDRRVAAIAAGTAPEQMWLVEHPPLFTAGTSAKDDDIIDARHPVFGSGRGGQVTYHGPGQRVAYAMIDLRRRRLGVRAYVARLEATIIGTLAAFGVTGMTRCERIGVWVEGPGAAENKVAAIGLRVRQGIAFHGVSINVDPDLGAYAGIVPCGVRGFGVTSLAALGVAVTMAGVDGAFRRAFEAIFGPTA